MFFGVECDLRYSWESLSQAFTKSFLHIGCIISAVFVGECVQETYLHIPGLPGRAHSTRTWVSTLPSNRGTVARDRKGSGWVHHSPFHAPLSATACRSLHWLSYAQCIFCLFKSAASGWGNPAQMYIFLIWMTPVRELYMHFCRRKIGLTEPKRMQVLSINLFQVQCFAWWRRHPDGIWRYLSIFGNRQKDSDILLEFMLFSLWLVLSLRRRLCSWKNCLTQNDVSTLTLPWRFKMLGLHTAKHNLFWKDALPPVL